MFPEVLVDDNRVLAVSCKEVMSSLRFKSILLLETIDDNDELEIDDDDNECKLADDDTTSPLTAPEEILPFEA